MYKDKRSKHVRSFSLSWANSRYLDGTRSGNYSEVVNRAIEYYRKRREYDNFEHSEILSNVEALQRVIRDLGEENETLRTQIEAQEKSDHAITDNIEPRLGGKWSRFVNFFRFHI